MTFTITFYVKWTFGTNLPSFIFTLITHNNNNNNNNFRFEKKTFNINLQTRERESVCVCVRVCVCVPRNDKEVFSFNNKR